MDALAGGRFRPLRAQPPGRFSLSYIAEDLLLRRQVALRILDRRDTPPHLQDQFRREARALASLRHASLPLIYDLLEDADWLYLVAEAVTGRPLDLVIRSEALPPQQALAVARQIGEALAVAHRHGLVHRDLHPRNIYLAGRSRAKLTNFEISRTPESPAATQILSSIHVHEYLAPEQLFKGQADARSDLYSLGMVLYRMLAGPAGRVVIGGTRNRSVHLPAAPHWSPSARRAVEPLLSRAIAPEPTERFDSAGAFVRALRACRAELARGGETAATKRRTPEMPESQWGAL
ncbi:MAG: serine/threonine-protein kinase [Symbiobacteriia bacterium]